jgi:hypothetical protein
LAFAAILCIAGIVWLALAYFIPAPLSLAVGFKGGSRAIRPRIDRPPRVAAASSDRPPVAGTAENAAIHPVVLNANLKAPG